MISEKDFIKRVGENIVKAREEKGLKQIDLATKLDIEASSLRRIEKARTNTTLSMLVRIANALEIDIQKLFM